MPSKASARWLSEADVTSLLDIHTAIAGTKTWAYSRAIIDATRPFEWRDQFPIVGESSPERRAEVLKKWGHIILS